MYAWNSIFSFVAGVSFLIFLVLQFVFLKLQYSTANLQRLKPTTPLLKILRENGSFSKYKLAFSRHQEHISNKFFIGKDQMEVLSQ